jgi:hypothetical protein
LSEAIPIIAAKMMGFAKGSTHPTGHGLIAGENMSEAHIGRRDSGALDGENANAAVMKAAEFLYLAAAPTFAIMALLTGVLGSGSPDAMCPVMSASPLSGMVPMYVLMSAFHSAPWLKLILRRRWQ